MQCRCPMRGFVSFGHGKAPLRGNSPPTRQPGREAKMPAIEIETAGGARTGVEPFVIAPKRKIHLVLVKRMGNCTDAMRTIKAYQYVARVRFTSELCRIQELAAC